MFGAVPASLILDYARSRGAYYQLDLDLDCPPWVFVDPEYLVSLPNKTSIVSSSGVRSGWISSIDHPSFTSTRNWLESQGYIKCEHNWSNGDRVIKPFYFNNVYMDIGEQFSCAPAMKYRYGKAELYNDGQPLSAPNYKPEEKWDDDF